MAYALIARCPRSGQLGIGIASYSIAAGLYCDGALRANTGATLTQGAPNPRNNYLAISLLAQGRTAKQALAELLANDSDCEYRQVAVVDRENQAAAYSGDRVRGWAGCRTGNGFAALGDMLAGEQVLDALVTGFEAAPQAGLDERLLAALESAGGVGGMAGARGRLPERSAALIVWGGRTYNEIDIRVDLHERAIEELRRIYGDYMPSIAYYEERARNPRNAIPAMEFADMLKAGRAREAG
ncbi:MAG TPA: DUF1028 domain-containing protein [Burkholderiales bacterium]|nr:DUF1028 domain-containing protein [Burkholderiales bacterium]